MDFNIFGEKSVPVQFNDSFTVSLDDAIPDMVLKEDIIYNGYLLLRAGSKLTNTIISQLRRRGVKEVKISVSKEHIPPQWDTDVNSTIDVATYNEVKNTLRNLKSLDNITIDKLLNEAKKIVNRIIEMEKFSYSLADYHAIDKENNASHAVRVCVYSLVLAKAYNENLLKDEFYSLPKIDYMDIAMAALLHDIGMACQDSEVLKNTDFIHRFGSNFPGLSEEKLEKVTKCYNLKYDPYYAFCMLHDQRQLSSATKSMILFSRENEKGTGPLGYTKLINGQKDIKKLDNHLVAAEIINLCSEFDKMLCVNISEKATLENVQVFISNLISNRTFNIELIELLLKNIPLYPFGTKVQLAGEDNTYAIVVENFSNLTDYHRPVVMSVPNNEMIDLREGKSTIVNQIYGREMRFSELYTKSTYLETPKR